MSKKMFGTLCVGAFAVAAVLAVGSPALAESNAHGQIDTTEVDETSGVDRIAMTSVVVDAQSRTFSFKTSERFGDPQEHVLVKWTGDDTGFEYAVTSLQKHPELFHVFRLYNWKNGKADCSYYYHTAG